MLFLSMTPNTLGSIFCPVSFFFSIDYIQRLSGWFYEVNLHYNLNLAKNNYVLCKPLNVALRRGRPPKIIRPIPQEFLWILMRSEYDIVAGSPGNSSKYYLHSFDCFLSFLKYIYEESNYTNFLAHFVYTCVHSCAQMFGGHMLMLDVFHNFFFCWDSFSWNPACNNWLS